MEAVDQVLDFMDRKVIDFVDTKFAIWSDQQMEKFLLIIESIKELIIFSINFKCNYLRALRHKDTIDDYFIAF